eukprot:5417162-Prymnesium_polylepis.2
MSIERLHMNMATENREPPPRPWKLGIPNRTRQVEHNHTTLWVRLGIRSDPSSRRSVRVVAHVYVHQVSRCTMAKLQIYRLKPYRGANVKP